MSQFTSEPREQTSAIRSAWFWLLIPAGLIVLFFAGLGVYSAIENLHARWTAPPENAQAEESGLAPWLPKERRADLQRRIAVIDGAIPAIEGELRFLRGRLKKEQARAAAYPDAKEYIDFIRREQVFLAERIDELQADRAYFFHELHEK